LSARLVHQGRLCARCSLQAFLPRASSAAGTVVGRRGSWLKLSASPLRLQQAPCRSASSAAAAAQKCDGALQSGAPGQPAELRARPRTRPRTARARALLRRRARRPRLLRRGLGEPPPTPRAPPRWTACRTACGRVSGARGAPPGGRVRPRAAAARALPGPRELQHQRECGQRQQQRGGAGRLCLAPGAVPGACLCLLWALTLTLSVQARACGQGSVPPSAGLVLPRHCVLSARAFPTHQALHTQPALA
jgi:hypothetical protein